MSIHNRLSKKQLNRFNILDKDTHLAPCTFAPQWGVKLFICWALAEFKFSNFAILLNKSYFLSNNVFGAKNRTLHSIPPQRGRLGGVQPGWCKNSLRPTSSFKTSMEVRCKNSSRQTSSFKTSMEGGLKKC